MMTSNLLSRLLPSASDPPYEAGADVHPRSHPNRGFDMDIDEENLQARFEAQDLENLLADASVTNATESRAFSPSSARRDSTPHNNGMSGRPAPSRPTPVYDDDDVPESLLFEGDDSSPANRRDPHREPLLPTPVPGPSTRQTQRQWDVAQRHQRLHEDPGTRPPPPPRWSAAGAHRYFTADPKERALWQWVNVLDLDTFLAEVYSYYTGSGVYSIVLRRFLATVQTAFVVAFITFLSWCVDYSKLSHSHKMSEVLVPKCTKSIHGIWKLGLWGLIMHTLYSFVRLALDIPKLWEMHNFYHYLLEIPDRDIQTVEWQRVVTRIMTLRDLNLTTASNLSPEARKLVTHESRQRLDAVDIASRLMRQDNYLIALFNKELLDVTVPLPFFGNHYVFSETTRFHVQLAILDFVFSGPNNTFNPDFLKYSKRKDLVEKLKARFFWVGIMSVVYAPFAVVFVLASYMFKYFTEYHKDPSQLGLRDFTPFAQWKFREFNELPHLFNRRRNMAYPYANHYLAQFPKDKTEQVSAFVAFVAGAFAFVLFSITLLDSELFLNFEITPGKTALFWIGVFTAVYRIARSSSPQEDQVRDPAYYLDMVNLHTRYQPASWENRLHTDEVRMEFSKLYQLKVMIFAEEVLSMIITPFLLIFRLTDCSERIVDFFREFSIHVDGLGVVCSFSMFPFKKTPEHVVAPTGPAADGRTVEAQEVRDNYFKTKDDKMLNSFYGFMEAYGQNGPRDIRPFHPPPQFPNQFGTMSQTAHPLDQSVRGGPVARQGLHHRSTRHGRDESVGSGMLEPRHQAAAASAMRASPRQGPNPRYRSGLASVADAPSISRQNSRIDEESTLGDSWRTGRFVPEEEEGPDAAPNQNAGVLQLLQEFSKAQAGSRGVGGV